MSFKYNFKLSYIVILILAATLNLMGVLVVRSASNMNADIVTWQILGSVAGFILCMIISFFDYHKLMKVAIPAYVLIIAILFAVLGWGATHKGAGRWIVLPVIGQVQPAEFAKAGLIFCFACFFEKHQMDLNEPRTLLMALAMFALPAVLIFLEPNLSTTIIFFVIFVCMFFVAGISMKWLGILSSLACALLSSLYFLFATGRYENIPFIQDYQKKRILNFLDPSSDPDSYRQQANSIIAIGSGGFFGKGLYNTDISSVKAGNFLIEEETDFIFAIIGEELGFRGSLFILLLFVLLIFVILWIAGKANDVAGNVICVGVAAWIGFQTFTNIAVATALFPNTGVTLPFFSRGVSSLAAIYIGLGLVLNVCLQTKTRERI